MKVVYKIVSGLVDAPDGLSKQSEYQEVRGKRSCLCISFKFILFENVSLDA